MKKIGSKLFDKFQENQILDETLKNIQGGIGAPVLTFTKNLPSGPGGTTNDCTGTGGDCWDADGNTNVVDDATWTGGKESGNDTCD